MRVTRKVHGVNTYLLIDLKFSTMFYAFTADSDWPFITQSILLQADLLILDHNK